MEKYLTYIFFLLAMIGVQQLSAQDKSNQGSEIQQPQTITLDLSSTPTADLKHPQGAPGTEPVMSANPAKPTVSADPKIASLSPENAENHGSTIAKPSANLPKDSKLQEDGTLLPSKESIPPVNIGNNASIAGQGNGNDQPIPPTPKGTVNFSTLKGPDTQPEPSVKGKAYNFRELNGTNEQPKGAEPVKK